MNWIRGKIMRWLMSKLDCPVAHEEDEEDVPICGETTVQGGFTYKCYLDPGHNYSCWKGMRFDA